MAVPVIYFLFPETGYRSLEEVDVIFHAASLGPRPWLNVRKIAANEPLWYGKDGEEPFLYEDSEWHKKHVRFSDEIKTSDGSSPTLINGPSSDEGTASPMDFVDRGLGSGAGRKISEADEDWKEKDESPMESSNDAAPSPVVARTSRDKDIQRNIRSAGRDTRSAGKGY